MVEKIVQLEPKVQKVTPQSKTNDKIQTRAKNQIVLDKALESEFRKTLGVFDVFVDSVAHVDTRRLKTKMIIECTEKETKMDDKQHVQFEQETKEIGDQLPQFRERL